MCPLSVTVASRGFASRGRVTAAGRPVLLAAQRCREIHEDLTLEQILDMIVAIASIRGNPEYLEPIPETTLDGLRPPTDVEPRGLAGG